MARAHAVRITAVLALLVATAAVGGASWLALDTRAHPAGPPPGTRPGVAVSPAPEQASAAPTLWYSAETAHDVLLLEAPLDGSAPPRLAATRPSGPAETARAWHVGPAGDVVLWVIGDHAAGTSVVAGVDLRTGRTVWEQDVNGYPEHGSWSSDGRQWAAAVTGGEGEQTGYLVVDVVTGDSRTVAVVDGASPLGFTADGDVVLGERLTDEAGWTSGWRFHRLIGATGRTEPLPLDHLQEATLSGPALEVSAIELTLASVGQVPVGQDEHIPRIQLVDLVTGKGRYVGPADASDVASVSFTPDGSRLLLEIVVPDDREGTRAVTVLDLEGVGGEVWRGPLSLERIFSPDGRYAASAAWLDGPEIGVLDLDTGRSVDVPLAEGLVSASPRAIRGGGGLPVLAIAEPPPMPSPPATPTPSPLPGGPVLARAWVEEAPGGDRLGHVELLVPAQGGGAVVTASLEPIELGAEETIAAEPFPAGDDWLVSAGGVPGLRLWRWTPGERPVELDLPVDAARAGSHAAVHPDGRSMAIQFYPADAGTRLAIVNLAGGPGRTLALKAPYTELAGWAGDGERLVLGHHVCTEGCEGRYASQAWLDPATGSVTPFGPTDRDTRIPAWHGVPYPERGEILLSSIHDEVKDDIVLEWPGDTPMPHVRYMEWSPDLADLYLELVDGDVSTLAVIRDAAAGGPGRHPAVPEPIGELPAGLTVHALHPGERWLLAADRANDINLLDIETGTAEPLDADLTRGAVRWAEGR